MLAATPGACCPSLRGDVTDQPFGVAGVIEFSRLTSRRLDQRRHRRLGSDPAAPRGTRPATG
jgi:hypothetical protein